MYEYKSVSNEIGHDGVGERKTFETFINYEADEGGSLYQDERYAKIITYTDCIRVIDRYRSHLALRKMFWSSVVSFSNRQIMKTDSFELVALLFASDKVLSFPDRGTSLLNMAMLFTVSEM